MDFTFVLDCFSPIFVVVEDNGLFAVFGQIIVVIRWVVFGQIIVGFVGRI